jgi:hypothetical protein
MPEEDLIAGLDEEGLRRLLGELLAANRGTQANFDEIRQQFPIQPSNAADSIPTWEELEEGGLEPPSGEEPESFPEQLGLEEAMGVIVHGKEAKTPRGENFPVYTWIGSVEPKNMLEFDIWIDTS